MEIFTRLPVRVPPAGGERELRVPAARFKPLAPFTERGREAAGG